MSEDYNAEQVVAVGREAAQLLQSQVFAMAYGAVLEDLQNRFFNTEPGHTRTLEEIRREGNAIAKVVTNLNKYVVKAEQVLSNQQGESE